MTSRIEPDVRAEHQAVSDLPQDESFAELVQMMTVSPLAVLIGPRGEATSRFARAAAIACAGSRDRPAGGQSGDVVVLFDKWSADPLVDLCDAIAAALRSATGVSIARSLGDRRTLAQLLARWAERTGANFIIVLDHYEHNLAAEPLNARNARFAEQLAEAIDQAAVHVRFLVVVGAECEAALVRLTARLGGRDPGVVRLAPPPAMADRSAPTQHGGDAVTSPILPAEEPLPDGFSALADDQVDRVATDAILRRRQRRKSVGRWRNTALGATLLIAAVAGIGLLRQALAPDPGVQLARTLNPESSPVTSAPSPAPAVPKGVDASPSSLPEQAPAAIPSEANNTSKRPTAEQPTAAAATPRPVPQITARPAQPTAPPEPSAVKPKAPASPAAPEETVHRSEPPLVRAITLASPSATTPPALPKREARPQAFGADTPPGPPIPLKLARAVANPEKGPMLFIHIRSESQRTQARRIASGLARLSIVVSGIRVDEKGPLRGDLRYFRAGERDEANYLGRALATLGVSGLRVTRVEGYEATGVPRHYELWLPPPTR